jgi:hypothetical protein
MPVKVQIYKNGVYVEYDKKRDVYITNIFGKKIETIELLLPMELNFVFCMVDSGLGSFNSIDNLCATLKVNYSLLTRVIKALRIKLTDDWIIHTYHNGSKKGRGYALFYVGNQP